MKSLFRRAAPPIVFLFFVAPALGAERTNPNLATPMDESGEPSATESAPTKPRKWAAGGNLGVGFVDHRGAVEATIDDHRRTAGSEKSAAIAFDGFFGWKLTERTLLGPSLAMIYESYDSDFTSDLTVMTVFPSLMIQLSFDGDFHRGLFARIDAGFALTETSYNYGSSSSTNDRNYSGTGLRGGLGYTIPAGKVGVPIMLQYQYVSAEEDVESHAGVLTGGVLF